jgi:hypothetical protein
MSDLKDHIKDPWLVHALDVIESDYGVKTSATLKNKDLLKFGRSEEVQSATKTTIMSNKSGIYNETYVSSNLIDTLSSSSGSDTVDITVEGHTIDGNGDFTFLVQTATLDGQNKVTLTTPLARMNRIYNVNGTDLVGTVYGYQDTAISSGVPTDGTKIHITIPAGLNSSEKCATTISSVDYWIVTSVRGGVLEKTLSYGDFHLEIRTKGGVFIDKQDFTGASGSDGGYKFKPYLIVPANSDIRIRATASANDKEMSASIQGVLVKTYSDA